MKNRIHSIGAGVVVAVVAMALGACGGGSGDAPAAPSGNAQLQQGRAVWKANCAKCHGTSGGGGIGPQLSDGKVTAKFPAVADQIRLVEEGKGAMPAWKDRLSDDDIEAVVAYTREVLAAQ